MAAAEQPTAELVDVTARFTLNETHCSVPDCPEAARHRGPFKAMCDRHWEEARLRRQKGTGLEQQVKELLPLARRLQRARERYEPVRTELAEATREWSEAVERLANGRG
jgi:hypothetical protein